MERPEGVPLTTAAVRECREAFAYFGNLLTMPPAARWSVAAGGGFALLGPRVGGMRGGHPFGAKTPSVTAATDFCIQ